MLEYELRDGTSRVGSWKEDATGEILLRGPLIANDHWYDILSFATHFVCSTKPCICFASEKPWATVLVVYSYSKYKVIWLLIWLNHDCISIQIFSVNYCYVDVSKWDNSFIVVSLVLSRCYAISVCLNALVRWWLWESRQTMRRFSSMALR